MKLISDEDLMHAGVPGMKWGFNKGRKNGKREALIDKLGRWNKNATRKMQDTGRSIKRNIEDFNRKNERKLQDSLYGRKGGRFGILGRIGRKMEDNEIKRDRKMQDAGRKIGRKIGDVTGISNYVSKRKVAKGISKLTPSGISKSINNLKRKINDRKLEKKRKKEREDRYYRDISAIARNTDSSRKSWYD